MRPELDSNGKDAVVVLEFPIYQALVAKIAKLSGLVNLYIIGRALNILITLLTAAVLYAIGKIIVSPQLGLLSAASFLLIPSTIFWFRTILIDPLAMFCGGLFLLFRMRSNVIGTDGKHRVMNLVASSITALKCMQLTLIPTQLRALRGTWERSVSELRDGFGVSLEPDCCGIILE